MTQFSFEDFLNWERASRDTIDVKRAYIDMAGDLEAGVMLSQIIWHYLCARHNKRRVVRDNQVWLLIEREEWWPECRIAPRSADRLLATLKARQLIITKNYRVERAVKMHLRIHEAGFGARWQAVTASDYVSRPPGFPSAQNTPDLTDSLFTAGEGETGSESENGLKTDAKSVAKSVDRSASTPAPKPGNTPESDAKTEAGKPSDFTKPLNQNSPNGEIRNYETVNSEFTKPLNQNSPNREIYQLNRECIGESGEKQQQQEADSASPERNGEREKRLVVVAALRLRGIAETGKTSCEALIAQAQAAGRDFEYLLRQCRAYDLRNEQRVKRGQEPREAGELVAAIVGDWPLPKAVLEAERKAAQKAEREQKTREQSECDAAEQAEATRSVDALNARLEAFEAGLTAAELIEVDAQARKRLPPIHRDQYDKSKAQNKRLPPVTAPVWKAVRRETLIQRLEKGID